MFNNFLSAVLRGGWLIDGQFAESQLPIIASLLAGKLSGQEFLSGNESREMPFYILQDGSIAPAYINTEYGISFNGGALTQNAIAVVPFVGAVTKYNGDCGEPGTIKRQGWIKEMTSSQNVVGYISLIDSPGGQADGTPQIADFIKTLQLPTAAVIAGGAYSAGAWIASAHDMIFAADKYAEIGSIGAYTTVADFSGYFEKQGIKLTTIYPEVSKDKNKSYREALAGRTELITKEISDLATSFVNVFAENRDGKLTSTDWQTGKCFNASTALDMGMIDGINGLMEVATQLFTGTIKTRNQNSTMDISKFKALAGQTAPSPEALAAANAELTTEGITGVTLVEESVINEAAAVTAQNATLTEQLATAQEAVTIANTTVETANAATATANTALATANAEIEALTAKLAARPGATHQPAAGADKQPTSDDEIQAALDALPHNKNADRLFG